MGRRRKRNERRGTRIEAGGAADGRSLDARSRPRYAPFGSMTVMLVFV
jgi:hypothetical protein